MSLTAALTEIYGIGPVLASTIANNLVECGLAQDREYTQTQIKQLLKKPHIYRKLPESSRAYLEYEPLKDIPRQLISVIENEFHKHCPNITCIVAGSYRRGKPISHDIDVVLVAESSKVFDTFRKCINQKSKILRIYKPFARGESKVMTIVSANGKNVKIDFFICPPDEYIPTLLFATGSGAFNVRMRGLAKRKGYLLNQKGLYDRESGKKVEISTEKDIFRILGMRYKEPHERIK